jgi:uncharacterized membrane protein
MKTKNKVLMMHARETLDRGGNWSLAVGATLIYIVISGAASFNPFFWFLVGGPLAISFSYFFLSLSRNKTVEIGDMLKGFDKNFLNPVLAMVLITIYVLLWAVLLIIPGIIAALSYSQVFFILVENPSMSASDAIAKSKAMMEGYKWKYFCLFFRFIGWIILSIFTLGIGFLFLAPYMQVTFAKFYDDIQSGHSHSKIEEKNEEQNITENME